MFSTTVPFKCYQRKSKSILFTSPLLGHRQHPFASPFMRDEHARIRRRDQDAHITRVASSPNSHLIAMEVPDDLLKSLSGADVQQLSRVWLQQADFLRQVEEQGSQL